MRLAGNGVWAEICASGNPARPPSQGRDAVLVAAGTPAPVHLLVRSAAKCWDLTGPRARPRPWGVRCELLPESSQEGLPQVSYCHSGKRRQVGSRSFAVCDPSKLCSAG